MARREEGTAARTEEEPGPDRAELEGELASARRALDETLDAVQDGPDLGSRSLPITDAVAHLRTLIASRMEELEEKRAALEAANAELRSLTRNLDSIVRQRTRALAESESQLRRKNVELDRLNRIRTEFISIAAHELRTPMTSLVGYLDLFSERIASEMTPESRRQLTSLHRNAHRLKRLVEDMLDVSRLDTGTFSLRRAPSSLAEIVLAVVDELGPIITDSRQVELSLAELAPIDADADKIHQVISNLLANSLKFTTGGGRIRITIDSVEVAGAPRARLRVWDNGKGIPADVKNRIFEPFTDVVNAKHHTSNNPDSAGLGLRIARGIVELHGGSIDAESVEGEYTEFTVLLPFVGG
jgi:signal transduction histidine kinase